MFTTILLVVLFVALMLQIASTIDMQNFMAQIDKVETMEHLAAFKSLARRQMYLSLGLTLLLQAAALLALVSTVLEGWGPVQVGLVVTLLVAVYGTHLFRKSVRTRVQNLPSPDKGLDSLLQAVCVQWMHRTLPEF